MSGKAFFYPGEVECREERQYALFLCNELWENEDLQRLLLLNRTDLFKEYKSANVRVESIYYEFAFLRDYFHTSENKKDFNKKLLEYCTDKWNTYRLNKNDDEDKCYASGENMNSLEEDADEIMECLGSKKEYHLGRITKIENMKLRAEQKAALYMARCMMNAKPDIVVCYRLVDENSGNEAKCMISLECKYKSPEDTYKLKKSGICYSQMAIQKAICEFINSEILSDQEKYMVVTSERVVSFEEAEIMNLIMR